MRVAFIGLAMTVAMVTPASAEACNAEPEPAVAALSDFEKLDLEKAKRVSNELYDDIKLYQDANKAYRECLDREIAAIDAKGKEATKADKSAKAKLVDAHNQSIESEEKLAKTFNAMLDSLCARGDKASCP